MKLSRFTLFGAAMAVLLTAPVARAQNGELSARDAVRLVTTQFGSASTVWLAEVRGTSGIPQPSQWDVIALDERAPQLLRAYWAGAGRAGDNGPERTRYPVDAPPGFFSMSRVGVDSVAAFTIAESEARKARIGFDSINYLLRLREHANDPVWKLDLVDASNRLVGSVFISALTGDVFRTIWVYRQGNVRPDGLPQIVDSAVPRGESFSTGITGDGVTYREPIPGRSGIAETPPATMPPATGPRPFSPVSPGEITGVIPARPAPPSMPRDDTATGIPLPPPGTVSTPESRPGGTAGEMRFPDLRESAPATSPAPAETESSDPVKPPIEVPESSGGGGGRIPPPPIPSN